MPDIFNIANSYKVNDKKNLNKISFQSGKKFSGKIVEVKGSKEVIIKLRDGSEINAEIEGDIRNFKGLQKFEVDSFKDGRLKLKLIDNNIESNVEVHDEFSDILLKNGLKSEDINLLKDMIKFNIPLNKENIKELKGLVNFLDKLNTNITEGEEFIYKFLESKNIDEKSLEGQNIKRLLNNFLNEYKSLSNEDIFLFFENDIEFNSENITAYKNIFKEGNKLFNNINDLKEVTKDINIGEKVSLNNKNIEESSVINNIEHNEIDDDNIKLSSNYKNNISENNLENKIASNSYKKLEGASNKISLLSIIKSLAGYEEDNLNTTLKDILLSNKDKFNKNEFDKAFTIIENIKSENFISNIEEIIVRNKINEEDNINKNLNKDSNKSLDFTKSDIENLLSKDLGKNIEISDSEFIKIKDIINLNNNEATEVYNLENNDIKEIEINNDNIVKLNEIVDEKLDINNLSELNQEIKENIKIKTDNSKEVLKDIINIIDKLKEDLLPEKVADFLKNNINEIKLFNKLSLEYYYADIPININEREYPCKIIIKDKRQDNKKIDASNMKMIVTIDTANLGSVDGYIRVLDKKLYIDLKCENEYTKIISKSKDILISNIKALGFLVDVNVYKKEKEISLANCREFFNDEFVLSLDRRV